MDKKDKLVDLFVGSGAAILVIFIIGISLFRLYKIQESLSETKTPQSPIHVTSQEPPAP
jgi:hypothetical protein